MKEFRGVLKNWYRDGPRIIGYAIYHEDPNLHGEVIHTSTVVNLIKQPDGNTSCETRNSMYTLLGEEWEGPRP